MPKNILYVRASLENVSRVIFNKDKLIWCLDVSDGKEEVKSRVEVDPREFHGMSNSRGTANLVLKWPGTKSQATLSVYDSKRVKDSIDEDDHEKWVPIAAFEGRGIEPVACHTPLHGITVVSTGGTTFESIQIEDGDGWIDFCPKAEVPVSVSPLSWKFEADR